MKKQRLGVLSEEEGKKTNKKKKKVVSMKIAAAARIQLFIPFPFFRNAANAAVLRTRAASRWNRERIVTAGQTATWSSRLHGTANAL